MIVTELKAGMKPNELARSLGVAQSWVSDRLAELRSEILFASGEFPQLSEDVFGALEESIKRDGVLVPVVVDEHGDVIDGKARRIIARRLGIECPEEIRPGLSDDDRRSLAITLNVARRQLTNNEKRMLVTAELMHDGDRSNRAIARVAGVDDKVVGRIREQLREDGVAFDQAVVEPEDEAVVEAIDNEARVTVIGEANCPCCGVTLRVVREAGIGLVLQHVPIAVAA
jgi:DNA-binding Lrp family transcriptional regulator